MTAIYCNIRHKTPVCARSDCIFTLAMDSVSNSSSSRHCCGSEAQKWRTDSGESFWTFQIKTWLSILVLSVKGRKKFVSDFNLVYMISDAVGENERIW